MILMSPIVAYEPGTGIPYYESPTPTGFPTIYPTYDQWNDVPANVQYFRYFPEANNLTYVPVGELTVWSGQYLFSDKPSYFRVDQNGFLAEKFDDGEKVWIKYQDFGAPFMVPPNFHQAPDFQPVDKAELAQALLDTGLFIEKTKYITIGDEPVGGSGVLSLKSMLLPDEVANLKKFFTFMPRQMLRDWYMKKVYPSIPDKQFENMVWASFIEIFNEANLEHINLKKIDGWAWEAEKLDAYYVSQNEPELAALESQISEYGQSSLAFDPQAKAIMEQYAMLPKIGDLGLEINRQNAIKVLLQQKDYQTAQAIVDAFRYAADTVIGDTITQPIPYNIVAADGSAIVRRSEG